MTRLTPLPTSGPTGMGRSFIPPGRGLRLRSMFRGASMAASHGACPPAGIRQQVLEQASLALDKKAPAGQFPPELSILSFQSVPIYLLASRGGTCSRLLSLSDEEEVLLRGALFENLQCVHQLIVVRDTAALGRRITECQPRDGVAKQPVDF